MARTAPNPPTQSVDMPSQTLVVDPGAHTLKAGLVAANCSGAEAECSVIPNCMARSRTKHTYIGSSLSQCNDFGEMQFKTPVERGYIVNWDLQRAIFEHEFFDPKSKLYCDPSESALILAEPTNAPQALQSNADQIIFEEFLFTSASRLPSPSLDALNPLPSSLSSTSATISSSSPPEILLLISASHSNTTITPLLRSQPIHNSIRRMTLGGKHITNYLAELISLRHFSLIDEPYIVNQIKEDACFVSPDFNADLERTWRGPRGDRRPLDPEVVMDYVLPDYEKVHRGFLRPSTKLSKPSARAPDDGAEESFTLANERFVPPELLFNPTDIGLQESGIPETVMQCLSSLPRTLWQGFLANIVVTGGTSLMPGFVERVESGVRRMAPEELEVRVARAERPVESTFLGGARVAGNEEWRRRVLVTKAEYEEHGEGWVRREFGRRRVVAEWGES